MQRDAGNHTDTKKPAPVRVSCELGGIVGRPETGIWCRHPGSNWGPTAYKAVALPTELCRQFAREWIAARCRRPGPPRAGILARGGSSEEHTSELQSLMRHT